MAAITMEHLVKKYDDGFPAVNDISIAVSYTHLTLPTNREV